MRLHCLQHVPFEDAANIAVWAERHGHRVTVTRLDLAEPLPNLTAMDWLVIMGGPMNVYEHEAFQFGDRVIGLQFHLDYSADSIQRMIEHCGDELRPGPYVETDARRLVDTGRVEQTQALLDQLLDSLHEQT